MCINSKVLVVQVICFLLCLPDSWGMYMKPPGFDPYGRNKRGHTTVCVEIKPNGAGSHEPYYMCKGPEFPVRQHILPPHPVVNGKIGNYALPGPLHKTKFDNVPQQPLNIPKTGQTNAESYTSPLPQNAYNQHYNKPKNDPQMHYYPTDLLNHQYHNEANNPTNFLPSNLQNKNENTPPSAASLSKSEIVPLTENKNRKDDSITPTTNDQQTIAATQPQINSEQFKALIDEEVLGTPNLGFSEDEMLPFHNMYSDPKHDDVYLGSQGPIIPPEYLDDPILRTFYNINDEPKQHLEHLYGLHINPLQPMFNDPSLAGGNINDCSDSQTNVMMPSYINSAEPTHKLQDLNSCCGCPLTFQPIFIAIPWFGSNYHDLFTQMHPCGHRQNPAHYSHPEQSRLNTDIPSFSSIEDLTNKKISSTTEIKTNSTVSPTTATTKKQLEFSEDDDSVEVVTSSSNFEMDKVSKSDNDETLEDKEDDKDNFDSSTTSTTTEAPFTTPKRTFKTRLHAAKMLAQMYSRGQNQNQDQNQNPNLNLNKRQIPHLGGGVGNGQQFYPYNIKRQYVRKLPKMYY